MKPTGKTPVVLKRPEISLSNETHGIKSISFLTLDEYSSSLKEEAK